ncbi:MAG: 3-methyl-2-oxobutanoate hydroxymethyltransferase, partial [Mesorhizobium sp.]|uniref:3-methyl-2-oxobutanoate hydroxymethyltransferase n=1 Tax=unclassified Mesorhizobium TaxID=325217 RepID=UPI000FE8B532|nr:MULTISPECIES: 3-methyl-2-oxobutanoate hydroxymethyltransferase [unclassified Mesorhizobium]RWI20567.1 MAG: 3-methyl-2-oxobutanoate hydroxymethyltransferase [Mesorhizobium sp.]RWK49861.1 MAG: 3-methyl-2-oxobutanoate hydroxymethyltransferase [Mesorhizobium sp.]RWK90764.1 MAG: 3-methyl-2-oxobutanoate hydroxymethyltransferase [Mesorhizobium sp.]TIP58395.1 MAG: 3-methyl-2-oxobutanoate hydroxymethyltransferase [Mesorhizobium sp.]TIQ20173.1 MAG: 3-methyl-2-oxobutanoate hydroxymethyltransferase [Me
MSRKRPTVADLRAMKGKRQLTMLRVLTMEEAEAAERAGVDIVSVPPELVLNPQYRDAAPSLFTMPGDNFYEIGTADDFVRWAFRLYKASADAVYCSAGFATVKRLADDNIPVIGHVGLIPSRATWTGGFKAVGKTADSAMQIFEAVKQYEAAGAIGAEIEVVPVEVAKAISERTSLIMLSMGAGTGCDAQYLFADDVLGQNRSHMPRHSKVYRNFAAEFDRLQAERIAAFSEYVADVNSMAYPEDKHVVHMDPDQLGRFMENIDAG